VSDPVLKVLVWVLCFPVFLGIGIVATFFPRVIQRAALSTQPKFKFIPKPQELVPGGREYLESRRYIISVRISGALLLFALGYVLLYALGVVRP